MGSIDIKRGQPADLLTLQTLGIETFVAKWGASYTDADMHVYLADAFGLDRLQTELENDTTFFYWIAYHLGTPAGYAKLRLTEQPVELAGKKHIELERLYLIPAFLGKKIGQALMHTCLHFAQTEGYEVFWLGVNEYNTRAMEFYRQWGFTQFSDHVFVLGDQEDVDILVKKDYPFLP